LVATTGLRDQVYETIFGSRAGGLRCIRNHHWCLRDLLHDHWNLPPRELEFGPYKIGPEACRVQVFVQNDELIATYFLFARCNIYPHDPDPSAVADEPLLASRAELQNRACSISHG
jgi:hypothetical protein